MLTGVRYMPVDTKDHTRDPERPDPDALLKEIERETAKRGRLKIFLGYAPGVGKTYAMLQEARVLKDRGEDIVVGVVETHRRAETEALLEGLEIIPRRKTEYGGLTLEELDVDAVLARRPAMVLVDELAHTNAPDSKHPKRYQDVEDLLGAGIDVYATINIQHIESQVDVVAKITGIRMQETVPDTILDRSDEVQVIDIPLEELSQRLREGKVYIPERAKLAMDNFFQRGNLVALRELTLTLVARKMDTELLNYMKSKAISGPWPAGDRVMVCIGPTPYALQLLRHGYKVAKDAHADWYGVYVSTPGPKDLSDNERGYLADALHLAEELGAKVVTLSGTDVATEILHFAQEYNIVHIVIGKPLSSGLKAFFKRSPVKRLLDAMTDFELHLVTPTLEKRTTTPSSLQRKIPFYPKDYAMTLGMVGAVTVLVFLLEKFIRSGSLVFIYLTVTIGSALFFGLGPSLFASAVSLLTFDFFFTEPRFSFTMYHPSDVINAILFVVTAVVVAQLVKTTRQQSSNLQLRLRRVTVIEEMSKEFLMLPPIEQLLGGFGPAAEDWRSILPLLRTTVLDDVSQIIVRYISRIIEAPSFILFTGGDGKLKIWARSQRDIDLDPHQMAVAEWTYTHGETAGAGTQTLANIKTFFMPMKTHEQVVGVIGIQYEYRNLLLDERRLLGAVSNLSSLAVARWINV
jgi:two-component system, OmpR family, sensor histidine kinase KdpD